LPNDASVVKVADLTFDGCQSREATKEDMDLIEELQRIRSDLTTETPLLYSLASPRYGKCVWFNLWGQLKQREISPGQGFTLVLKAEEGESPLLGTITPSSRFLVNIHSTGKMASDA